MIDNGKDRNKTDKEDSKGHHRRGSVNFVIKFYLKDKLLTNYIK